MIPKVKLGGIYVIEHRGGGVYIGCSCDIMSRWQSHYSMMKMGTHTSTGLMELFNRTTIDEWTFKVLEYISKSKIKMETGLRGKALDKVYRNILYIKEKEWMAKYDVSISLNKNNKAFDGKDNKRK